MRASCGFAAAVLAVVLPCAFSLGGEPTECPSISAACGGDYAEYYAEGQIFRGDFGLEVQIQTAFFCDDAEATCADEAAAYLECKSQGQVSAEDIKVGGAAYCRTLQYELGQPYVDSLLATHGPLKTAQATCGWDVSRILYGGEVFEANMMTNCLVPACKTALESFFTPLHTIVHADFVGDEACVFGLDGLGGDDDYDYEGDMRRRLLTAGKAKATSSSPFKGRVNPAELLDKSRRALRENLKTHRLVRGRSMQQIRPGSPEPMDWVNELLSACPIVEAHTACEAQVAASSDTTVCMGPAQNLTTWTFSVESSAYCPENGGGLCASTPCQDVYKAYFACLAPAYTSMGAEGDDIPSDKWVIDLCDACDPVDCNAPPMIDPMCGGETASKSFEAMLADDDDDLPFSQLIAAGKTCTDDDCLRTAVKIANCTDGGVDSVVEACWVLEWLFIGRPIMELIGSCMPHVAAADEACPFSMTDILDDKDDSEMHMASVCSEGPCGTAFMSAMGCVLNATATLENLGDGGEDVDMRRHLLGIEGMGAKLTPEAASRRLRAFGEAAAKAKAALSKPQITRSRAMRQLKSKRRSVQEIPQQPPAGPEAQQDNGPPQEDPMADMMQGCAIYNVVKGCEDQVIAAADPAADPTQCPESNKSNNMTVFMMTTDPDPLIVCPVDGQVMCSTSACTGAYTAFFSCIEPLAIAMSEPGEDDLPSAADVTTMCQDTCVDVNCTSPPILSDECGGDKAVDTMMRFFSDDDFEPGITDLYDVAAVCATAPCQRSAVKVAKCRADGTSELFPLVCDGIQEDMGDEAFDHLIKCKHLQDNATAACGFDAGEMVMEDSTTFEDNLLGICAAGECNTRVQEFYTCIWELSGDEDKGEDMKRRALLGDSAAAVSSVSGAARSLGSKAAANLSKKSRTLSEKPFARQTRGRMMQEEMDDGHPQNVFAICGLIQALTTCEAQVVAGGEDPTTCPSGAAGGPNPQMMSQFMLGAEPDPMVICLDTSPGMCASDGCKSAYAAFFSCVAPFVVESGETGEDVPNAGWVDIMCANCDAPDCPAAGTPSLMCGGARAAAAVSSFAANPMADLDLGRTMSIVTACHSDTCIREHVAAAKCNEVDAMMIPLLPGECESIVFGDLGEADLVGRLTACDALMTTASNACGFEVGDIFMEDSTTFEENLLGICSTPECRAAFTPAYDCVYRVVSGKPPSDGMGGEGAGMRRLLSFSSKVKVRAPTALKVPRKIRGRSMQEDEGMWTTRDVMKSCCAVDLYTGCSSSSDMSMCPMEGQNAIAFLTNAPDEPSLDTCDPYFAGVCGVAACQDSYKSFNGCVATEATMIGLLEDLPSAEEVALVCAPCGTVNDTMAPTMAPTVAPTMAPTTMAPVPAATAAPVEVKVVQRVNNLVDDFDTNTAEQDKFKQGIVTYLGTPYTVEDITNFAATKIAARRHLLAANFDIDYSIAARSTEAANLVQAAVSDTTALSTALSAAIGTTVTAEVPQVSVREPSTPSTSGAAANAPALALAALLALLISLAAMA